MGCEDDSQGGEKGGGDAEMKVSYCKWECDQMAAGDESAVSRFICCADCPYDDECDRACYDHPHTCDCCTHYRAEADGNRGRSEEKRNRYKL